MIKRIKQKFKTRDEVKREIKKDVVLYAQKRWPMIFSRVFTIELLSGPLIDEMAQAAVSISKDGITFYADDHFTPLNGVNHSEVTEIVTDQ